MFNIDKGMPLTESGVWTTFSGSKFLITHLSSIRFQREVTRLQQPYRKKIDAGTMDPKVAKDLMCQAMAKGLILDWQDVTNNAKESVAYSSEAAYTALSNDPEFRELVSDFASNLENFREAELEEVGKP